MVFTKSSENKVVYIIESDSRSNFIKEYRITK